MTVLEGPTVIYPADETVSEDQEDTSGLFRFAPVKPLRFDTAITAPTARPPADLSSSGIPIAQESPSSGTPEAIGSMLTPQTELTPSTLSRDTISVSPSLSHQLATLEQTPNPGPSSAPSHPPGLPTGLDPANVFPEGSLRRREPNRRYASQFSYLTSASTFDAIHRLSRLLRWRHVAYSTEQSSVRQHPTTSSRSAGFLRAQCRRFGTMQGSIAPREIGGPVLQVVELGQ
jgi:hypothetical protein